MVPILRNSERNSLKRCPQKWHWAWRQGLRPKRDANPLWFGQGIHLALAEWYLNGDERGPHPVETWQKFVADEERYIPIDYEEDEYKFVEAKELGVHMLEGYIEEYGTDENWDVIATEQTFSQLIPKVGATRKPTKRTALANFVGTVDGVYRDKSSDEIWLMEHKTAKAIFVNHLPLDDQAGSYFMVATEALRKQKLIGPKEELQGIQYNFLRKGKADTRPTNEDGLVINKDGSVSKRQPSPLFRREPVWRSKGEREQMKTNVQSEVLLMNAFRNKELPLFKNPTRDCSWDCGFYRMCMLHEAGEDWKEYAEAEFVVQDPYLDHRRNRKSASS